MMIYNPSIGVLRGKSFVTIYLQNVAGQYYFALHSNPFSNPLADVNRGSPDNDDRAHSISLKMLIKSIYMFSCLPVGNKHRFVQILCDRLIWMYVFGCHVCVLIFLGNKNVHPYSCSTVLKEWKCWPECNLTSFYHIIHWHTTSKIIYSKC